MSSFPFCLHFSACLVHCCSHLLAVIVFSLFLYSQVLLLLWPIARAFLPPILPAPSLVEYLSCSKYIIFNLVVYLTSEWHKTV